MHENQESHSNKRFPDAAFDVVAVGASAGGVKALGSFLAPIPGTFQACILVVQHIAPDYPSLIASILKRRTQLDVAQARHGDMISPGMVFIAPPDQHLLVNVDGSLTLSHSPPVHWVRPSADILFQSVAAVFGERAIAVILTGTGLDGAAGAQAIKQHGGLVIAQDQATSEFFGMPDAAIHTGVVDKILPLDEIAQAVCRLVSSGVST